MMSLTQWLDNGWVKRHETSRQEISALMEIARRDLGDARSSSISDDWRFGIAYNAVLKLCTVLVYAEGYRPDRNLAHYRTLQALPLILGESRKDDAVYLDACRIKRHSVEYDAVGGASRSEVSELIEFTSALEVDVMAWLKAIHPAVAPGI
jgi:hypothetical protein